MSADRSNTFRRKLAMMAMSVVLAASAVPAGAQRCLGIDSDPQRATITLESDLLRSQTTPANFCDLQPELNYKLSVFRPGYETRYLNFSFSAYDQPPDISGIWLGMTARSVVLPGWAQASMGQASRSLETWLLLITDGFKVWQVYDDYSHTKQQYDNWKALTELSETQQQLEDRALLTSKLAEDTNAYRESLILTAAVGGWVYLHNVVESYLISASPKTTRAEAADFKVTTPKKSAGRAVLRSLFFPGLGQRYAGHGGRSFLFHSGVFVLALFTVDAKLRYDLAVVDRNYTVTRFNNQDSVPEREAMARELLNRQETVERRKDRVIAFAVATGALWLANVFEAWGSGGGGTEHADRFEMSTTYRNATLYQEIRLSF